MNQFSTSGEPIEIELLSHELVFIDPVYLQSIVEGNLQLSDLPTGNSREFIKAIETKFFPYGGGTLIGLKKVEPHLKTYRLNLKQIKLWKEEDEQQSLAVDKLLTTFGIDSASFLIFDIQNFEKFLHISTDDFYDLDATTAGDLIPQINSHIGNKGWAFIETPGIGHGYEFEGDGSYIIQ